MPAPDLQKLIDLVARLRAPDGCPWDREQSLGDVRAYLLEEAHETAGAIDSGDWDELAKELGDLLFQVAFIGRLAEEAGAFDLSRVIEGVHAKMVARHPHVFGGEQLADAEAVRQAWERRKLRQEAKSSLLEGVSASLPALLAAYRLTQKASGVGFDWPDAPSVLAKVDEELSELKEALADGAPREALREEVGDLLFTLANLARKLDLDPEAALAQANLKFRRRFESIEKALAATGKSPADSTLEEMDDLWAEAKRAER
ncbi:MAG TPA: nucleoside triphosphate pyrophosphohydrolase [Thermoanaerobaculia bacterium]|nr:nucleoside triphosphate pyrophosphohydrolase [Thermoanaerobaculia bacterium]